MQKKLLKISVILLVVFIFLTSISAMASQVTQKEVASSGENDPVAVVREFYEAIANREFKTAYYLRSGTYRSEHSYIWFYNNWSSNKYIELISATYIESDNEYEAVIKIRTYSEDYNSKGKLTKAYYRGKAYLVWENGWKIDDVSVKQE